MEKVFHLGADGKDPNETLKDYLMNTKGMTNAQYRKAFNKTFRDKIDADPSCQSFDVSCWLPAIQNACDGLAPPGDEDVWLRSPDTLEFQLKKIKDTRNALMHSKLEVSSHDFYSRLNDIRSNLIRTLELAKIMYSVDAYLMDQIIGDINVLMNGIRDDPLAQFDLQAYQCLPLFQALQNILESVGLKDLEKRFDRLSQVNPASLVAGYNILIDVGIIYVSLEIIKVGRYQTQQPIEFTDILFQLHQIKQQDGRNSAQYILIEGVAGSGKTTMIKKFLASWTSGMNCGNCCVNDLCHYKFIIPVECRQRESSLSSLIASLMPSARMNFQNEQHMKECLLCFPTLIIVDGLDELNTMSKQLFMEIVSLSNLEHITVICTTRPERVADFYRMLPENVGTLHIKIKGVPVRSMECFLSKYHEELRSRGISNQETDGLIKYFRTTGAFLKEHWSLPLNLSLLSLLWAIDPARVNHITTPVELLYQIHTLTTEKLLARLEKSESTKNIDALVLKKNISAVVSFICREALLGIRDDTIVLQEDALQRLQDKCHSLGLPPQEVLGAFLVQSTAWSPTGIDNHVAFAHKAIQEFYGMQHIYNEMFDDRIRLLDVENLLKTFMDALSVHGVSSQLSGEVINCTSRALARNQNLPSERGAVLGILEQIHSEIPSTLCIEKYQNILTLLIGFFYLHGREANEDVLQELISLLQTSGVNNRERWVSILNSIRCSDKVARLICQLPDIMEGIVRIVDSNVFAYATLFKIRIPECVAIDISSDPTSLPRMNEIFSAVMKKWPAVENLYLDHLFRNHSDDGHLKNCLEQILQRCQVKRYSGQMTNRLTEEMFLQMEQLQVSVPDDESFLPLKELICNARHQLEILGVSVSVRVDPDSLCPLVGVYNVDLFLPDLKDEHIQRAVDIVKKLSPKSGGGAFDYIFFPRCQLTPKGMEELLGKLGGITILNSVHFSSSCKPTQEEDRTNLNDLVEWFLGAEYSVKWGQSDYQRGTVCDMDSW